ncbi:MAG: YicC family protein [Clostridia bacterium]|nr:YicC family protein [Clostridia bacterium]
MIRSMTGYGRHQAVIGGYDVTVELKSVNHRYFEYSSRLPRTCGFLDDKLKTYLQGYISRGKVDVYVSLDAVEVADSVVVVNTALAKAYRDALESISTELDVRNDVSAMSLARFPDVLTVRKAEADEEAIWAAVQQVAEVAVQKFVAMRELEGERMRADVLSRRETILNAVSVVEERSPQTVREHMEKVEARMRELLGTATVDEQRLLTEAAIFADKIATAEETVRLRSHMDQLQTLLDSDEPIGRKLDFLVQEINRETNTIGSKATDLQLAQVVVDVKAEIEKIREQIQNIE